MPLSNGFSGKIVKINPDEIINIDSVVGIEKTDEQSNVTNKNGPRRYSFTSIGAPRNFYDQNEIEKRNTEKIFQKNIIQFNDTPRDVNDQIAENQKRRFSQTNLINAQNNNYINNDNKPKRDIESQNNFDINYLNVTYPDKTSRRSSIQSNNMVIPKIIYGEIDEYQDKQPKRITPIESFRQTLNVPRYYGENNDANNNKQKRKLSFLSVTSSKKLEQDEKMNIGCCQNPQNDSEVYECLDCTNGRCTNSCRLFGLMCACPTWFWFIFFLFNAAVLATMIAYIFLSTNKPVVTKYNNLSNTYNNLTIFDRFNYIYSYAPCIDNYTSLINVSTTKIPLCNRTTTRIVTSVNKFVTNNIINSVQSAVSEANNNIQFKSFFLNFIFIIILFLFNL